MVVVLARRLFRTGGRLFSVVEVLAEGGVAVVVVWVGARVSSMICLP